MNSKIKKYLSILLIVVMCISMIPASAFAEETARAEDGLSVTVSMADVSAVAGDSINLCITIAGDCRNLCVIQPEFTYDVSILEPVLEDKATGEISVTSAGFDTDWSIKAYAADGICSIAAESLGILGADSATLSVAFTVKDDAQEGDYSVTFDTDSSVCVYWDGNSAVYTSPVLCFADANVIVEASSESDEEEALITYDANGGIGVFGSQNNDEENTVYISRTIPTREGYKFLGWSEDSKASVADYKPGDEYRENVPIMLYAVWKEGDILTSANFPDVKFLSKLETIYTDGLTLHEAETVTKLNLTNAGISNLTGIEFFKNLEHLQCSCNYLRKLDLSCCTKLKSLYCHHNNLSSLDISGCNQLTELGCYDNKLSNLDLSGCTELKELHCGNNSLCSLDVSANAELTALRCFNNKLGSLNLSENKLLNLALLQPQNTSAALLDENTIDLNSLAGAENAANITVKTGGTYDASAGLLSLDSYTDEVVYDYATNSPDKDIMTVTVKVIEYVVSYVWSYDCKTCTAKAICSDNHTYDITETVKTTEIQHEAPTCKENGITCYTAAFESDLFYEQTKEKADIPALGHDLIHHEAHAATCTEAGCEAYDTCSRCDYTTYKEISASGHHLVHHEAKSATCTEYGWEAYDTCSRCDYTTYNEIPALGHDLIHHASQAATCTEYGWEAYDTCSRCDYTTYNETTALGHDLIHHEEQTATCTEPGWEAYDACSRCDYTTYKEIPATGHHLVYHEAKNATCTEYGWEAYDTCSRCDYTTYNEIPALGHDLVHHAAQAATCTEAGWEAYDTCSECDYTTYNEIPALGHDYTAVFTFASDGKTATAVCTCAHEGCGYSRTVNAKVTSVIKTESTRTEMGTTTYTATCSVDGKTFTDSVDIEDIPFADHNYGDVCYSFSDDGSACTATRTCTEEDCKHSETALAKISSSVTTPATCTEKGTTTYSAVFNEAWAKDQSMDIQNIPSTGHDYAVELVFADDGKSATAVCTCRHEGCEYSESGDAVVSSVIKTDSTCTNVGTTTYTATYSIGGKTYTASKDMDDIPKKPHSYGEASYLFAADGSSCTASCTCTTGNFYHVDTEKGVITSAVEIPATCTEKGVTRYTATFTEPWAEPQTLDVQNIDALGHDYIVKFVFADDGKTASAVCSCSRDNCDMEKSSEAIVKSAVKADSTCAKAGITTYTATYTIEGKSFTDSTDRDDIEKKPHSYGEVSYSFAEDGSDCTASRTCTAEDCGYTDTASATISSCVKSEATYTEKGTTRYTATFTVPWAAIQTKDIQNIPVKDWEIGDINQDGSVNATDLSILSDAALHKIMLTENQKRYGDIYTDGKYNALDINLLRRYLAGIVAALPVR